MIDFQQIWALLYDHGASAKKEEGTRRFWETLTAEEQMHVFTTISTKLKEGKFVQYDPIRAIKESLHNGKPAKEPTNYNGCKKGQWLLAMKTAAIAKYKGRWGIYDIEDIREFGMETRG